MPLIQISASNKNVCCSFLALALGDLCWPHTLKSGQREWLLGTHIGDSINVNSGKTQVTNHLQASVAGSQVKRSPAIL